MIDFEQYSNWLQLDLISLLGICFVARKLIINGGAIRPTGFFFVVLTHSLWYWSLRLPSFKNIYWCLLKIGNWIKKLKSYAHVWAPLQPDKKPKRLILIHRSMILTSALNMCSLNTRIISADTQHIRKHLQMTRQHFSSPASDWKQIITQDNVNSLIIKPPKSEIYILT